MMIVETIERDGRILKAHISRNWLDGFYNADLLGGELDNCYGQGRTADEAIKVLKLSMNARRRERARQNKNPVNPFFARS